MSATPVPPTSTPWVGPSPIIVATPPTEHDRDHRLRFVLGPETSAPDKAEFTRRFGVPLFEGYGSSENAIILKPVAEPDPAPWGGPATRDDVAVVDPTPATERPRAPSTPTAG